VLVDLGFSSSAEGAASDHSVTSWYFPASISSRAFAAASSLTR
jgi:hypothetical protein